MDLKSGCGICGKELVYRDADESLSCNYCGNIFNSNVQCANGHYICDQCHSLSANDFIQDYCVSSESTNPFDMAMDLMRHPSVKMHGPEHHFLVPAVLLAAYYNYKGDAAAKEENIKLAQKRSANILGGFCGYYGDCGAAVGTGIFLRLITKANPLSGEEWRLSNLMTASSLLSVAKHGGPRCCKRNTYLAIIEAVKFLNEHFGVDLPIKEDVKCIFSPLNRECLKEDCPFNNRSGTQQVSLR